MTNILTKNHEKQVPPGRRRFVVMLLAFGLCGIFAGADSPREEGIDVAPITPPVAEAASSSQEGGPELILLGVMSPEQAASLAPGPGAYLIRIPTREPAGEFFVCRLNHLAEAEIRLLADAADGRWDQIDFLYAVLIAEGQPASQQRLCLEIYQNLRRELLAEMVGFTDGMEKARRLFEFLHRRVLTGAYNLNRSSVAVSLRTGVYNCVSATALFNAFATEVELDSRGLETTGHAKSRLLFPTSYLDIETTCTRWEHLPDKPISREFPVSVARPIPAEGGEPVRGSENAAEVRSDVSTIPRGGAAPSFADYAPGTPEALGTASEGTDFSDRGSRTYSTGLSPYEKRTVREVSPVEFVATIYYNRGVDFYQQRKYGPAIAAYLKAALLDANNQTVLGNLKATLNNLAIELATRQNFADAVRLTEQGLAIDPEFDQFRANLPLYYRHWADAERNAGRTEEAERIEKALAKHSTE